MALQDQASPVANGSDSVGHTDAGAFAESPAQVGAAGRLRVDPAIARIVGEATASARSGPGARPGPDSPPSVSGTEQSTLSGVRAREGRAARGRPLRAHQDVEDFLVGVHQSAEAEAQLQVEYLRQQEHSQLLSDSYRRRPAAQFRQGQGQVQVSEFEQNLNAAAQQAQDTNADDGVA